MQLQKEKSGSMKVKKGWLAVMVGLEEAEEETSECDQFRRFVIPISHLYRPLFKNLLESARDVYGYHMSGPLKLPCSVDDFIRLLCLIEQEPGHLDSRCGSSSFNYNHRQRSTSSMDSCSQI